MECPTCFKAFPIQEIAEHADICASWHVESVGETITIDENNLFDNNEFGIGDYEPGQTFVSLIKELQNNLEPGDPVPYQHKKENIMGRLYQGKKKESETTTQVESGVFR